MHSPTPKAESGRTSPSDRLRNGAKSPPNMPPGPRRGSVAETGRPLRAANFARQGSGGAKTPRDSRSRARSALYLWLDPVISEVPQPQNFLIPGLDLRSSSNRRKPSPARWVEPHESSRIASSVPPAQRGVLVSPGRGNTTDDRSSSSTCSSRSTCSKTFTALALLAERCSALGAEVEPPATLRRDLPAPDRHTVLIRHSLSCRGVGCTRKVEMSDSRKVEMPGCWAACRSRMSRATLTMSHPELERLEVIQRVRERRLTQGEAATMLGLGVRQVQRLCAAYRDQRAAGLVSGRRGRRSNRRLELPRKSGRFARRLVPRFGIASRTRPG